MDKKKKTYAVRNMTPVVLLTVINLNWLGLNCSTCLIPLRLPLAFKSKPHQTKFGLNQILLYCNWIPTVKNDAMELQEAGSVFDKAYVQATRRSNQMASFQPRKINISISKAANPTSNVLYAKVLQSSSLHQKREIYFHLHAVIMQNPQSHMQFFKPQRWRPTDEMAELWRHHSVWDDTNNMVITMTGSIAF